MRFKEEVMETFLRCAKERFGLENVIVELNGLRLAENRTFVDCASYIFTTILGLAGPPPRVVRGAYHGLYTQGVPDTSTKAGRNAVLGKIMSLMREWGQLLKKFIASEDDEVDLLLALEEFCSEDGVFEGSGEHGAVFADIFEGILQVLYHDNVDILSEEGILKWVDEKEHASESERRFLRAAQTFVDFLKDDDDDDDDDTSSDASETASESD